MKKLIVTLVLVALLPMAGCNKNKPVIAPVVQSSLAKAQSAAAEAQKVLDTVTATEQTAFVGGLVPMAAHNDIVKAEGVAKAAIAKVNGATAASLNAALVSAAQAALTDLSKKLAAYPQFAPLSSWLQTASLLVGAIL